VFHADTLRECFRHHDWARNKILTAARGLIDQQLDQPFAMGPGSLRAALRHLYGAERFWFELWQGTEQPQFPHARTITTVDDIWNARHALATARDKWLSALTPNDLHRRIAVTNREQTVNVPLGGLVLHVCNHGVHHRAQALNMLRRVGGESPGLDYLLFRLEQPTVELDAATRNKFAASGLAVGSPPALPATLDVEALQAYFRYADWSRARVHAAARALPDDSFDAPFDIGLGTLRKTLLHIRDAEAWWYATWTEGPGPFNALPATTTLAKLQGHSDATAQQRDAYLAGCFNDDLQRVVAAQLRPDLYPRFRLGESMLQLCSHGTHHRAQALNMLRHLGSTVPDIDCDAWLQETGGRENTP